MFDESDDNYVNTFKIKISFKDLEGKCHKKITNIYNKENILVEQSDSNPSTNFTQREFLEIFFNKNNTYKR